jgi:hypothetical protein
MFTRILKLGLLGLLLAGTTQAQQAKDAGLVVDKDKKTITIPAMVAPRKLAALTEIYPIEVVATWPTEEKAEKAHETVVLVRVKPSDVHKALEGFGLKAGKPGGGEDTAAEGPELKISLELPGGKVVPIEKTLIDKKTGKTMPALKWRFCGSAMKQLDPSKPDQVYGADETKTLITIFPVTQFAVIMSNLTMKDEPLIKMETNKAVLPAEGTEVKLIIAAK